MSEEHTDPLSAVLEADPRYTAPAYVFVYEALQFTTKMMGLDRTPRRPNEERHVTGQQLLEGIRRLALREFGFLARTVFESWGVTRTGDWGEIVFNLVNGGIMQKRDEDSKDDFAEGYDHADALEDAWFRERMYTSDDAIDSATPSSLGPVGPFPVDDNDVETDDSGDDEPGADDSEEF